MGKLAVSGGTPVLERYPEEMFHWPIVNDAMRKAQADLLESGNMSGTDVAKQFESAFAAWNQSRYALSHNNGTNALTAAMYAVGVGPGDEVICPSVTYWASCTGALSLGAAVVFCDIREEDLQLDPASFEAHITPRTRAVVAVHYMSCPADMERIMAIARKHDIRVIEDVSHAQGGHYKGKPLGTFGDVGAMSLMSGKSFAIGEGGMLITDDTEIYRRAVRWGHYDRIPQCFKAEEYAATLIVPFGGVKNRMHQTSAAIGIEQLKKYDAEIAEIDRAMKYFWRGIADVPGLRMIHPKEAGSDKAGWYASRFGYDAEAFDGISNGTFCEALNAELGGQGFSAGCNVPLHRSSLYSEVDVYGHGKPTVRVNLPPEIDPRRLTGKLPVAEGINAKLLGEPWFKHFNPSLIDRYVEAVHKVARHHKELSARNDTRPLTGGIALTRRR